MTPAPALQSDMDGDLKQAQVKILWGRDCATGRITMERHAGLIDMVNGTLIATSSSQ
jgi:hypothetical protein